jgi:glutamate-5-semialdehyde dehydrogenase
MLERIGKRAKDAAQILSQSTDAQRQDAVRRMADELQDQSADILAQNDIDIKNGRESGMSESLLDRLALTEKRINDLAESLREVALLPDPLGETLWETTRPNGIQIARVSVPLGVIAVIYEARPNVTADSAALCLRSGNACILRGGKEAVNSNTAIATALRLGAGRAGLPQDAVQFIGDTNRESAEALMRLTSYVDLLIPRGGQGLINSVVSNARVPTLKTGTGVCHIYVDREADVMMARDIIDNAKTSRPSVCNACECMLIHQDIAREALPKIAGRLLQKGVTIRGDEAACAIVPEAQRAEESDWGMEYLNLTIACRVVDSMETALHHIRTYGSGHSEAIITKNPETARRFLREVDAAAVYHNASTRFTDGGEFGFGAEIGISTQKLHARGPVGLRELCSYKYIVRGNGQTR